MSYIQFKKVSKGFSGNPVLRDVDFSIEKGEMCGFVGRNGSGKTVIFKLMTGLLVPDSGEISIAGENINARKIFPHSLGVMIETPGFIPHYSGMKNLRILNSMSAVPADDGYIRQLMGRLGLDPDSRKPVRTYSLGMRQKLGIVQAVMNRPELLVLDEPMNSLDADSVRCVRELFQELNGEGTTIVLASHIAEDVESLCTKKFRVDGLTVSDCQGSEDTV